MFRTSIKPIFNVNEKFMRFPGRHMNVFHTLNLGDMSWAYLSSADDKYCYHLKVQDW